MRNKAEMLTIVAGLFNEHGYHGTTMREIARALEMRETHLYVLFGSKEDILWAIVIRVAHLFLAQVQLVPRELPLLEQLQSLMTRHLEVVIQEREYVTVFIRDWMFLDEDRRAEIQTMRETYESHFYRVIQDGRTCGLFQVMDAQVACLFVLSALSWTQPWLLAVDVANLTTFTEQYILLARHAFNVGGMC